jgi:hypothetical protein
MAGGGRTARPWLRAQLAARRRGLCLHTILLDPTDPGRIFVAISAAGVFRSDNAGESWQPVNRGLHSESLPDPHAEIGHCVHRIAMHPSRPNVLFMQKHWDAMRSDDAGESWQEVSGNLPTAFGFAIDVHAHEPDTIYDSLEPCGVYFGTTGGQVYASADGGNTWAPVVRDLPAVLSVEAQTLP